MDGAGPRVLLDATAVPPDRGGVGRYVEGLLAALAARGADLVVACQQRDAERLSLLAPAALVVPAPDRTAARPVRLAWEQVGLPRLVRRSASRVLHSPHYTLPLGVGVPAVATLHDATFFTAPELHGAVKQRFFRLATRVALRRAARCVVPSQATRDELVRVARADASRIDVRYHGVDHEAFRPPTEDAVRRLVGRLGLDERGWIAFVGTHEPRKNLTSLVRGWVEACGGRDDAPALVLAGAAGWDSRLMEVAREVPAHLRLVRPGYLPVEELPALLGGALVAAYPSLGEGFGLPVLEAMACGAPVLTTRRLALPEVGGDAVAYTEPDPSSIATALRALLDDPSGRAALARQARERACRFSWDACAEGHLATYSQAAAA